MAEAHGHLTGLLSRANPMLNLPTKDLGFESQSSSSDLDHIR